jgi:hypothetical protein
MRGLSLAHEAQQQEHDNTRSCGKCLWDNPKLAAKIMVIGGKGLLQHKVCPHIRNDINEFDSGIVPLETDEMSLEMG